MRSGFISKSNSISILLSYIVIASYFDIYECAISLPKNVKVPAILVFGDSIVDPGNNNYLQTISKANFLPYGRDFEGGKPTGRYSNGKIPSDLIAEELGIKELVPPYLDPSLKISDLLTGVSFASGASGFDPISAPEANALSLDDQLANFREYISKLKAAVGENTTSTIISESPYFVFAGSNDVTNTFLLPVRRFQYDTPAYATKLVQWAATFVQELYALGARRIALTNAPPCGCLPSQRTIAGGPLRECVANENELAVLFNNKLRSELRSLKQKLPGSKIVYLDIYTPLLDLIVNPSRYGFEVSNRGCCGTGTIEVIGLCRLAGVTCTDPSKYVFWDSFHPTETAYRIIVDYVAQQSIKEFF